MITKKIKKQFNFFTLLFVFMFPFFSQQNEGILFQFVHKKGDAFSHVSTVYEEAFFNGRLNNKTEFINRTSSTVLDILEDGSEYLQTDYMTTQNSLIQRTGDTLSWGEENSVNLYRRKNGEFYNCSSDFLPTVRNVPSFPSEKIQIGQSWQAEGLEVHDCRELFQMNEALSIPFTATYTYSDTITVNSSENHNNFEKNSKSESKTLHIIDVYYNFFQDNTSEQYYKNTNFAGARGYAKQKIYWDTQKNEIDHFQEEFQIKMVDFYGNTYIFNGKSQGEVTGFTSVNSQANVKKLQETFRNYNLDNVNVSQGEKGLTLSIENIQFEPDSDKLLPSEQKKLQKIGEVLKQFNNDLLITGHCAERGTESARQALSESRAKSVADFLIKNNIRNEYHIFTQGKGSSQPVASNTTEEGRSRNRRVEITIMD